ALLALGTLGEPRALEEIELIANGGTVEAPAEPSMQIAAVEALGRLYPKLPPDSDGARRVWEKIESLAGEGVATMRPAAILALRWIGDDKARARLERLARDRSAGSIRNAAVSALAAMGDTSAETTFAALLDDPDWSLRAAARDALEKLFPQDRLRRELLG